MRLWRNRQTRYLEGVVSYARMGSSPINRTILGITKLAGILLGSFFVKKKKKKTDFEGFDTVL